MILRRGLVLSKEQDWRFLSASNVASCDLEGHASPNSCGDAAVPISTVSVRATQPPDISPRIASRNFVTECLTNDVTGGRQSWCAGQYFIDLEQSAV